MSSKPCYESLKLVSRCLKPKSFSKSPTSCKSQQIWFYSSEGSYLSKVKRWTSAKTTSAKNNWTFIRHALEPIDILKKNCDFKKLIWKKIQIRSSKRKWKKLLPHRLNQNNGVRAIQSFTLAKCKIFCRGHSVANSHQNCASGFQTVIMFIVQMFSNPTASFKVAKVRWKLLKYPRKPFFLKSTSEKAVVYILYQLNIWCTRENDPDNKIKTKKVKSSLSQPSFSNLFSQKFTTTERK